MKNFQNLLLISLCLSFSPAEADPKDSAERIMYHTVRLDADGMILPWHSPDLGTSYDHAVRSVWTFWHGMQRDLNGLPYYLNHQVWKPGPGDMRGAGGDQFAMALSSWNLLYGYLGDEAVKENMLLITDYYLTHSLSPANAEWPHIPYPYNTFVYSGTYDGDMILGPGFTQPDKAGSFGYELVKVYKMTGKPWYLQAAERIADTLARHVRQGDNDRSPLPFKVNALTGEIGKLGKNWSGDREGVADYTSNYAGTLRLLQELQQLGAANSAAYQQAFNAILAWMKEYPLKTNKWGPFFEDIPGWSDTQINAVTFADFIMDNRELFPEWQKDVRSILDWVDQRLGNTEWAKYGVRLVNEQTAYLVPGNSHSSRQGAAEIKYAKLSGDSTRRANAVRQLSWATYTVDHDGKNCYVRDEIWLTDGYGDYVRHYLRAMAADPGLAPSTHDRLLSTSSVLERCLYGPVNLDLAVDASFLQKEDVVADFVLKYRTYDAKSQELIRVRHKPARILIDGKSLPEVTSASQAGWFWEPMGTGGTVTINKNGRNALIQN